MEEQPQPIIHLFVTKKCLLVCFAFSLHILTHHREMRQGGFGKTGNLVAADILHYKFLQLHVFLMTQCLHKEAVSPSRSH